MQPPEPPCFIDLPGGAQPVGGLGKCSCGFVHRPLHVLDKLLNCSPSVASVRTESRPVFPVSPDKSCGIPEHRQEMAGRSRDDEQVPDEVTVANSLGREEGHAGCVRNAPCQQPENARQGYLG